MFPGAKDSLQGLKPLGNNGIYGAAEAAPLQNNEYFPTCKAAPFQNKDRFVVSI